MIADTRNELAAVGLKIRKAREAAGLTLRDLALLCGVNATNLSLIETGKRDLRVTSLFRIAAALRIGAFELFGPPSGDHPQRPPDRAGEGYDLEDYR